MIHKFSIKKLSRFTYFGLTFILLVSFSILSCKKDTLKLDKPILPNQIEEKPVQVIKIQDENRKHDKVEYGTYPSSSLSTKYCAIPYGMAASKYYWPNGHTITISFVDEHGAKDQQTQESVRNIIRNCAREWQRHANINFIFLENPKNAQLRIKLTKQGDNKEGKHSLGRAPIGTELKNEREQSKEYNMFIRAYDSDGSMLQSNQNWPEELNHLKWHPLFVTNRIENTVLHEFGHVLGLKHMHDHPEVPINVNIFKSEYGQNHHPLEIIEKVNKDHGTKYMVPMTLSPLCFIQ